MNNFYIARNKKNNLLRMFTQIPTKHDKIGTFECNNNWHMPHLDNRLFPEISYDNSPQEVEIVIAENQNSEHEWWKNFYVARNIDGTLKLYGCRIPTKFNGIFICYLDYTMPRIDSDMFPEITYDNSPVRVEIKLKSK